MADFPLGATPQSVLVSCYSPNSIGPELAAIASAAPASAAHAAANRVIFVPFTNPEPALIKKVWWYNGATASGNVDCGVFDENGVKLVSSGSVVQGTINVLQENDVTDTYIGRGRFYLALSASSGTATFFAVAPAINMCKALGMAQAAGAVPMAATYTLAAIATAYLPIFGCSLRTLVV